MTSIAVLATTVGLLLVAVALVLRARDRRQELLQLLELPYAEEELADGHAHLAEETGLLEPGIGMVGRVLDRLEVGDQLTTWLHAARVPLRPGELVLGVVAASLAVAVWLWALLGSVVGIVVGIVVVPLTVRLLVARRVEKRREAISQELPSALSLLASSIEAGHTLARAVDLLASETGGPLADELRIVLAETRLGSPLTDAMQRMAERVQLEDLEWVVRAIKVQRQTGGRLSELLHTLAEYLLAREEVRREVKVLTAEGRMSSWVLAALPFAVAALLAALSPDYMGQLLSLPGYVLIAYAVLSVLIGLVVIRRLVGAVNL